MVRLRVITGSLGGRFFNAPPGHRTHPMSERARGAIFNMLGDISGLSVLDAFSGSGALAFEAYSRGASEVTAVELDKGAYETIQKNMEELGIDDNFTLTRANVTSWANRNKDKQFDIVFIDPPYDAINYAFLKRLANTTRPGGIIVYSMPVDNEFTLPEDQYQLIADKKYAGATLAFYKAIG